MKIVSLEEVSVRAVRARWEMVEAVEVGAASHEASGTASVVHATPSAFGRQVTLSRRSFTTKSVGSCQFYMVSNLWYLALQHSNTSDKRLSTICNVTTMPSWGRISRRDETLQPLSSLSRHDKLFVDDLAVQEVY